MRTFTLILPLSVQVSPKKSFSLNLNHYRNAHYMILTAAKHCFERIMADQVDTLPSMKKIKLEYVVFVKTARKVDVANIGSIADKFFSDTLVLRGKLPDDNYHHLEAVTYRFGGVSRNPRIEVIITEVPYHASVIKRSRSTSSS